MGSLHFGHWYSQFTLTPIVGLRSIKVSVSDFRYTGRRPLAYSSGVGVVVTRSSLVSLLFPLSGSWSVRLTLFGQWSLRCLRTIVFYFKFLPAPDGSRWSRRSGRPPRPRPPSQPTLPHGTSHRRPRSGCTQVAQ